jgi:hypothetical protein
MPLNSAMPLLLIPWTLPEVVSVVQKSWPAAGVVSRDAGCDCAKDLFASAHPAPKAARNERRFVMDRSPFEKYIEKEARYWLAGVNGGTGVSGVSFGLRLCQSVARS